jgi:FkbM family methyltransferase
MYLDQDDSMGLSLGGVYEPVETKLVRELVRPGSVVLDVGANIGYFTLLFARLVGSSGHVIAFEPDPYSFDLLARNIRANEYGNVTALQLAASNQESRLRLYRDRFGNLDHGLMESSSDVEGITIRSVRLDDFLPTVTDRAIDFVKMDIQGSEGWALEGMERRLREMNTSLLLTEFWPTGLDRIGYGALNFLRLLQRLGFEMVDVHQPADVSRLPDLEQLAARYADGPTRYTNLLCRRSAR